MMVEGNGKTESNSPGVVFREAPVLPTLEEIKQQVEESRNLQPKEMKEEVKPPLKPPPLSLYEKIRHRPYSADYFELGADWERWNFPKEFQVIEGFIKEEIRGQGLEDTTSSYEEVIDTLENKIGKRENEKVWHRLDRLVSYIRAVTNFRKWAATKKKFEEVINA